ARPPATSPSRSAIARWPMRRGTATVQAGRGRATPRPALGSGGTIPAGAGRGPSTRSATAAERLRLVRVLVRLILVALFAVVALGGYAAYRIWDQGNRDEERQADAIVVLGAAQYDGRPSPLFAARLDHAIDLYQAGIAPRLILTGGKASG